MTSTNGMTTTEMMVAGAHAHATGAHAMGKKLFEDAARAAEDASGEDATRTRAKALANASACASAIGEYDDAADLAERAIAIDGAYAKAHARRAVALTGKREYARARASARAFFELLKANGADELAQKEYDAIIIDVDTREARGEGERRKGLHAVMGAAAQPKPSFTATRRLDATAATSKRVSFVPELAMDGVDDSFDRRDIRQDVSALARATRGMDKPMLKEFGVAALDAAMERRTPAANPKSSAVAYEYKRCKMCGNVCHAKMTSCSSCCLPLVAPESYEPATLPKVGGDAAYETDSDDESDDEDQVKNTTSNENLTSIASHETDSWWVKHFTRAALEQPEHDLCVNPALQSSFDALDCPPTVNESVVRAAYRKAVAVAHPDAGGSTKELKKVHVAYDAICTDFWRHDDGAKMLRERLSRRGSADGDGGYADIADNEDIFVILDVYRNREGEHTLKRLFERASNPERVFVGVTWQYKTCATPPDSSGACVDRLHFELNQITEEVTKNAMEIKDPEEQQRYLLKMRRIQLKYQRSLDAEEKRCHSRKTVDARFRDNVRETHLPWDTTDGPSYARHLALRKWGGEKYVLHIDAMTVVDQGWDATLVSELKCAEGLNADAKAVLTSAPLAYDLQQQKVIDESTFKEKYSQPVYGTIEPSLPAVDAHSEVHPSRAPALTCAHAFGQTLCHMRARQLYDVPIAPVPTLFLSMNFAFARAEAFVRDAPPDPHAPFLHLGEELSVGARLWTRGWNLFSPSKAPVRHCYNGGTRVMWMEDRRRGKMLYENTKLRWGAQDEWEGREFLNCVSRRRVAQLVGAPDANSATAGDEPVEFTKTYGLGDARSIDAFAAHVGIDFKSKTISRRAQNAGRNDGEFIDKGSNERSSSLPTTWRGTSSFDSTIWIGPSEFVG